jgi:hypothetical protein
MHSYSAGCSGNHVKPTPPLKKSNNGRFANAFSGDGVPGALGVASSKTPARFAGNGWPMPESSIEPRAGAHILDRCSFSTNQLKIMKKERGKGLLWRTIPKEILGDYPCPNM